MMKKTHHDHDADFPFESNNHSYNKNDDSHDEALYRESSTSADETSNAPSIPQHVQWPMEWHAQVDEMRTAPMEVFWELFSGSAQATKGSKEAGWYVGNPVGVANNDTFGILNPASMVLVISFIWEGLISVLWLGPPVVTKKQGTPGNALSRVACRLFKIAAQAGSRAI